MCDQLVGLLSYTESFYVDSTVQSKHKKRQSHSTPMEAQGTTSALDGSEWSVLRPGRALPQGKGSTVHNGQDAGWASDPVYSEV
jgi:hypothetical protein